jgi:hypothetical protein
MRASAAANAALASPGWCPHAAAGDGASQHAPAAVRRLAVPLRTIPAQQLVLAERLVRVPRASPEAIYDQGQCGLIRLQRDYTVSVRPTPFPMGGRLCRKCGAAF